MTNKTTFQTTLPNGEIATRTSATKTYTHAIVCSETVETQIATEERRLAQQRENLAQLQDTDFMEAHYADMARRFETYTIEEGRKSAEESIALVSSYIADHEAKLAELQAHGETEWFVLTWCGRLDLAQKALNTKQARNFDTAEIFEVTER